MKICELARRLSPETHLAIIKHVNECFGGDIPVEEFTNLKAKEFKQYLKSVVSPNTTRTYLATIKALLKAVDKEMEVGVTSYKVFSQKSIATISAYVNEAELKLLQNTLKEMRLRPKQRYYLLLFLISSYTGCRQSDAIELHPTNIQKERLVYISKKTGIKADVPAKRELNEWIIELNYLVNTLKIKFNKQSYNRTISDLAQKVGINEELLVYRGGKYQKGAKYKFISGHTARRSFATNLYLLGLDIYTISKFMGHSDISMTIKYICELKHDLPEQVKTYFK